MQVWRLIYGTNNDQATVGQLLAGHPGCNLFLFHCLKQRWEPIVLSQAA